MLESNVTILKKVEFMGDRGSGRYSVHSLYIHYKPSTNYTVTKAKFFKNLTT